MHNKYIISLLSSYSLITKGQLHLSGFITLIFNRFQGAGGLARAERDGTRAETRFRLSPKRTSPFK